MSTQTHTNTDVFADVVNDLMKELSLLPRGPMTIFRLLTNNLDSPILAEIQHLSLSHLSTNQMTSLLPALFKMSSLAFLALPICAATPDQFHTLFTNCPALSKLQSLDLQTTPALMSEDLLVLSQSTTLTNLTSLNLSNCAQIFVSRTDKTPQTDGGFAGFGRFGDLDGKANTSDDSDKRHVDINGTDLSGLVALLSSPVVQNLTHLDLGWAGINIHNSLLYTAIATSPFLSNLTSLDLTYSTTAVVALATSTTLTKLTHLNLTYSVLGDALIAQLFSPPSLLGKKLQSLDLTSTKITVSSLELLVKACPHLTELILSWNEKLGPRGAKFIATNMPNLTKLDLARCNIEHDGYLAIATSAVLTNLRQLNLSGNRAPAESIIALVNSPVMAKLTHFDLDSTQNGPEVLAAIAQSPSMSKLQHLTFSSDGVGGKSMIALAKSTTLTNLTSLHLRFNHIGLEGIAALCTSPVVSKLTSLDLGRNFPDVEPSGLVAAVLAAPSSTLYSLTRLQLCGFKLGNEGVLKLLKSPNLDQLDALIVGLSVFDGVASSTSRIHSARFG